jgi:hypothetical protein
MKRQRFSVISYECNEAIGKLMVNVVRNSHPLFRQMGESIMYEGDSGEIVGESDIATSDFATIKGHFRIEHDTIRKVSLEAFRSALEKGSLEIHQSQHTALFEQMNQVLEKTNRTFDAGGQLLSWELFLSMWEHVEFIFDQDGNWLPQTLVVDPRMMPRLQHIAAEVENDAIKKQQWRELLDRKRREFDAKEANRKLVD